MQIQRKEDQILYIGSNQHRSLITVGTEKGFRVFCSETFQEVGGRGNEKVDRRDGRRNRDCGGLALEQHLGNDWRRCVSFVPAEEADYLG